MQADDFTGIVDVNPQCRRIGGQSGHCADFAAQGIQKTGARRESQIPNREGKAGRSSQEVRIVRERVLRFWRCRWEGCRSPAVRTPISVGGPAARIRRRQPHRYESRSFRFFPRSAFPEDRDTQTDSADQRPERPLRPMRGNSSLPSLKARVMTAAVAP